MLKKILWALAPVIAARILGRKRGSQDSSRADKTRWDKKHGR